MRMMTTTGMAMMIVEVMMAMKIMSSKSDQDKRFAVPEETQTLYGKASSCNTRPRQLEPG